MRSIFEKGQEGQRAYSLPTADERWEEIAPPSSLVREAPLPLPALTELDLMRHFSLLAERSIGVDTRFYPLGSCTMKLNPRICEQVAAMPGFARAHPLSPEDTIQGSLQVGFELLQRLCEICGMAAGSLVPNAGAQGELAGALMIRAYHRSQNEGQRCEMLVPDNAHGTNPATAAMCGFETVGLRTDADGCLDLAELRAVVSPRTAGLMLTNPSTLGLFSPKILDIARIVHEAGGLLYYDGANLNPILNVVRVGQMGFDVMHLNLHKTFSTPHGGGGPGSGPVLCNRKLAPFLPLPRVEKRGRSFTMRCDGGQSVGHLASFFGNFGVWLRAYVYLLLHGDAGLRRVAEGAVLNANYLKVRIGEFLTVPYSQPCMHEFVVQADAFLHEGIRALDIAKRLLDYGMHPPTIYFPLIVRECMLIEPTETESKATLDAFVDALERIIDEIRTAPELVRLAPHTMPISRPDETRAARRPVLTYYLSKSFLSSPSNRS